MDSKQVEQRVVEMGLTAPRVTLAQIEELHASLKVHTHRFPGTNVIIAIAVLPDGFLIGEGFSACVSTANFDEVTGLGVATRKALENAKNRLWELEGYALRDRLACMATAQCKGVCVPKDRQPELPLAEEPTL